MVVLALGIAATTAFFAVVHPVLLRPLPYKDPGGIAVILGASELRGGRMPVTPGDFEDFRKESRSFEEIAAASVRSPTLTGFDQAETLDGLRVSAALFRVIGVGAVHGRTLIDDDERADASDVAVVSHGLFERRFGGDPAVVGRSVTLDGKAHTIVGVMPPEFYFPPFWASNAEIFAIGRYRAGENGARGPGFLRLFGRLKPGTDFQSASAEIRTIASQLAAVYRQNAGLTATVTPIHEMSVGSIRPVLTVLFGAVGFTLLIGCANVASLLIARAGSRRREVAIRLSLGAERLHLIRQCWWLRAARPLWWQCGWRFHGLCDRCRSLERCGCRDDVLCSRFRDVIRSTCIVGCLSFDAREKPISRLSFPMDFAVRDFVVKMRDVGSALGLAYHRPPQQRSRPKEDRGNGSQHV